MQGAMYRFCRGDKQGYNVGRPCRPRPREPAFRHHAHCVICANALPRPPYEISVSGESSEEDAEYVDNVEIERAMRRLPFLKSKSSESGERRSIWGVLGGSKGSKAAMAEGSGGEQRAAGSSPGQGGEGGKAPLREEERGGIRGTSGGVQGAQGARREDKREWATRVNAAFARSQPELRRKLSGSFTLYGLSRSNSRDDAGNSSKRGGGPGNDEPEVWVVSRPKPVQPRGPARCRSHAHTPSGLARSMVPEPEQREMVTVSLGLGLGRLGPFTITKTGAKERPGRAEKTVRRKSLWRRNSSASIASTASIKSRASERSTASTISTASIATTISTDMSPSNTSTAMAADTTAATMTKKTKRKNDNVPGTGTVSAWPSWTVRNALRVVRPQHNDPKPARERMRL